MIYSLIQILAIFVIPAIIIKYHRFSLTKLIGTIGMAYLLGIFWSLVVFGLRKLGASITPNEDIGQIGGYAAISIAIPLLLFSANLKEVRKLSKKVLISFASVIVSVILVSAITYYVYAKNMTNGGELSAMAIGLYTGGTPNLNALANIFGLTVEQIGVANFSDMIIGAVFYVFLLMLCKPLLDKFLKKAEKGSYLTSASDIRNTEEINLRDISHTKYLFRAFLLAFGMVLVGAGVGILIWVLTGMRDGTMIDLLVPSLMISVTILGIIASFSKKVREIKGTNLLGQYMILVFSFAIASSIDLTKLSATFGQTILLYGVITVGSFVVHVVFSYFLKIDTDCTMVTATAGIYGPAFVPAITKQIKNDELTVPGLICGSIGYAIGTFLGILLGLLFIV